MAQFAELLDTAIANADSRDQLTPRGRAWSPQADEARRRVVRDLHDGAQQRLVHTIVTLKLAQRALRARDATGGVARRRGARAGRAGQRELRELAHGILPAVLDPRRPPSRRRRVRGAARPAGRGRCSGRAVPAGDRGERLLHRGRGAHQRRQARARRARRGHRAVQNGRSASRFATTGSEAPIPMATAWSGWATARPRSVGGWKSRARPAAARSWPPRCRSRPASPRERRSTPLWEPRHEWAASSPRATTPSRPRRLPPESSSTSRRRATCSR